MNSLVPPTSPLLRPPSRSISGGSATTPNQSQGGTTTATSTSHVVYARPRGLSNRTHSNRDMRLQQQQHMLGGAGGGPSPSLEGTSPLGDLMTSSPMQASGSGGSGAGTSSNTLGVGPSQTATVSGKNARHRSGSGGQAGRKRSSSIVSVQEIPETYDEMLDQEMLVNINADWVNFRGAWMIHIVLLVIGKVLVDIIPGVNQTISWTTVLQLYMLMTFLMFHWVTGTPFSANGGAFDRLTFWEQIDHGAQNTPARKFLMSLPIGLFLLTTHYVRYDLHPTLFAINLVSLLLFGLAPKLPQAHRVRLRFFDDNNITQPGSTVSLDQLGRADRSRGNSPASGKSLPPGIQLTETNIKSLDGSSRGPPTPIEEESEPKTPVDRSPQTESPTFKRRFLS